MATKKKKTSTKKKPQKTIVTKEPQKVSEILKENIKAVELVKMEIEKTDKKINKPVYNSRRRSYITKK